MLAPGSTPTFQAEFARTVAYLNAGKASGLIAQLESRTEVISIKEGTALSDVFYNPSSKTITYNPYSALRTTAGGTQSPAVGFLHEADHALQHLSNPAKFSSDKATTDSTYDTAEEKRVITGSEAKAVAKLREDTRKDHGGKEYRVPHADTRTP